MLEKIIPMGHYALQAKQKLSNGVKAGIVRGSKHKKFERPISHASVIMTRLKFIGWLVGWLWFNVTFSDLSAI